MIEYRMRKALLLGLLAAASACGPSNKNVVVEDFAEGRIVDLSIAEKLTGTSEFLLFTTSKKTQFLDGYIQGVITDYKDNPVQGVVVRADPDLVAHVLTNLISNALKFTPKEGQVTIRTGSTVLRKGSVDEPAVSVEVSDTGMGMPTEELSLLFAHYRQVSSAKKVKEKGTGLGLAICKLIVEAHNGTIEVSSTLGKGTSFLFKLPVGQPNPKA